MVDRSRGRDPSPTTTAGCSTTPTSTSLYLAVPHDLHERLYLDAVAAGKDFLGEKPFGIDLAAAERIVAAVEPRPSFVRVSSELPFFPGAQRAAALVRGGLLGEVLEVRSGLLHSSDLDRDKPLNWKRRQATCGELGVMGDLGMHAAHLPLRLGWTPSTVYALLDDVVRTRPGPDGVPLPCDTWDNAVLALTVDTRARPVPDAVGDERIAPGESNTWYFEAYGMDWRRAVLHPEPADAATVRPGRRRAGLVGGAARPPQRLADRDRRHLRVRLSRRAAADVGRLPRRAGRGTGDRFGCATPREALRRTACSRPRCVARDRPERAARRLNGRASASCKGVDVSPAPARPPPRPVGPRPAPPPRSPARRRPAPAAPRRGPRPGTRRRCRPRRSCRRW